MGLVRTTKMCRPPISMALSSGNGSEYPPSNIHSPRNLTLPRVTMGKDDDATSASIQSRTWGSMYRGFPVSRCVVTTMAWVVSWATPRASRSSGACRMTCALKWDKFINPSFDHAEENRMNVPSSTKSREIL